jgi:MSHA biogenesis protein MshK
MSKALLLVTSLAVASGASAQTALPDPTRPPPGLQAATATTAASAVADTLVLQSVLLGPGRTPAAVISGRLVALGDRVGGARLARITAHAVHLTGPQGTTTLSLMPEGQKTAHTRRTEQTK